MVAPTTADCGGSSNSCYTYLAVTMGKSCLGTCAVQEPKGGLYILVLGEGSNSERARGADIGIWNYCFPDGESAELRRTATCICQ